MMRVLLTGASGFVGRHVLAALVAVDCEIVAITSRAQPIENTGKIKWIVADLLCEEECNKAVTEAKADVLIHMAWYAEHGKFWTAPENFDWSRATVFLLQMFIKQGGKRAVIAGTCAEYDWRYGYCTEGVTPTEPSSVYGQCKDATRRLTKALAEQSGTEWAWGRIYLPFGYGEPENRLLPSVINALLNEEAVLCSHGKQYRDFLPVEDVASAFVHLGCLTHKCGEFNVSSGVPTQITKMVEFCVEHLDSNIQPQYGAIKVPENDPPLLVGNNQKLVGTGWKAGSSWETALYRMVDQYKHMRLSNH